MTFKLSCSKVKPFEELSLVKSHCKRRLHNIRLIIIKYIFPGTAEKYSHLGKCVVRTI